LNMSELFRWPKRRCSTSSHPEQRS